MRCLLCQNLEAAFRDRWVEYTNASSLSFYGVNNQSAAYLLVEMERARTELEEHRATCFADQPMPVSSQRGLQLASARKGSFPSAA